MPSESSSIQRNRALTPIAPSAGEKPISSLVEQYLHYVRFEKRLAARTVELYTLDLGKLFTLAAQAQVELLQVARGEAVGHVNEHHRRAAVAGQRAHVGDDHPVGARVLERNEDLLIHQLIHPAKV